MRVLIIGADGQLGSDLTGAIPQNEQIALTVKELDITDKEQTLRVIKKHAPQVVINTAAYNRVDDSEDQEATAFAVNATGVKNVALACREVDAALVHFSSDYVFNGEKNKPYVETDTPDPRSVYGISKLAGEFCVKYILKKYFIVRSAGLYGAAGCLGKGGGNFVDNMIRLADKQPDLRVVDDEIVSPTYTRDLAGKIAQLIRTEHYGLYHIVNHGCCSWYDFTVKIFELLGRKVAVKPVPSSEFPTRAQRPRYSALENARLRTLGMVDLRPWAEALRAYLEEKKGAGR